MHALIASLLLAAGSTSTTPFPPDAALALLTRLAHTGGTSEIICARIDGQDPSGTLMEHLRRTYPKAVPASECTSPSVGVTYKPTGGQAVLFSASAFHLISRSRAEAQFETNYGPLGGNWYHAYFIKFHGKWVVERLDEYMES